jgi:DNA polymerase III sliding clamp (beta) subunit (PCNA family)
MATATAKAPKAPKAPAPPKLAAKPAVRPSAAVDFTVDRDALREIVDAARTVAKGGHMPIITYVRLAWTPDTLTASATDLVISYRSSRPCVASKPGDVCVPAAFFATIVASMPRGDLSVSVDPTSLRVSLKSAGARTASAIGGVSSQDFPAILTASESRGRWLSAGEPVGTRTQLPRRFRRRSRPRSSTACRRLV